MSEASASETYNPTDIQIYIGDTLVRRQFAVEELEGVTLIIRAIVAASLCNRSLSITVSDAEVARVVDEQVRGAAKDHNLDAEVHHGPVDGDPVITMEDTYRANGIDGDPAEDFANMMLDAMETQGNA